MKNLKKIVYKILITLFKFSIQVHFDLLTAFLLALLTKKLNVIRKEKKYRILCMAKSVFNDDVNALAKQSSQMEYLLFPRLLLLDIYKQYFEYNDNIFLKYHLDGELNTKRKELQSRFFNLIRYLKAFLGFDVILTGNFVYLSQQEFAAATILSKIPFVVLYKEGMAPVESFEPFIKTYHNKVFVGSRILFYNENIRNALVNASIPGLTQDISAVVGIPRLDLLSADKISRTEKYITLFSFYQKDKISALFSKDVDVVELEKRSDQFHLNVIEFAKLNPDYKIIIKTKAGQTYVDYINNLLADYKVSADLPNLIITNSENAHSLIRKSSLILGYMSTTLLEALYLGKRIASPYFNDLNSQITFDYFRGYEDMVTYIKNYDDLERTIKVESKQSISDTEISLFLSQFCFRTDRKSCERVESEIEKVIFDAD